LTQARAGLQLTPEQEKNWPPFEQAVRDLVNLGGERLQTREAGGEQQSPTRRLFGTPRRRIARHDGP
jgi:hypothetical protein